jgi:hypothetical protein
MISPPDPFYLSFSSYVNKGPLDASQEIMQHV